MLQKVAIAILTILHLSDIRSSRRRRCTPMTPRDGTIANLHDADTMPGSRGTQENNPEAGSFEMTRDKSFQTDRVVTISGGHAVHDTYSAFLPPLLPELISKFALSKTEAGLLIAILQAPSILQPALGHLADRLSLQYLVILAPGVTATAMSLLGASPNYLTMALLLIIAGLSSASMHAVGPVMAGKLSGRNLGRGMSFWMVGGELGRTLGPIIVVAAVGYLTLSGTRWLLFGGWIASAVLFLRLGRMSRPSSGEGQRLPWRAAIRGMRSLMVPLLGIQVARAFMSSALTTYLPTFLTEEGSSLWVAGASLSILEAAGVLGALVGGSVSDRLGRRRTLAISMLATPILLSLFLLGQGATRLATLPFLGFSAISTTPVILALVQETYPQNRALANGVFMALVFLIRAVVVIAFGGLGDLIGLRLGFVVSGALMILASPLLLLLPANNPSTP